MTKPVNIEYLQQRVADLEAEVEQLRTALDQRDAVWSKEMGFQGPSLTPELARDSFALVNWSKD